MTAVCSVGLDMVVLPGDTTAGPCCAGRRRAGDRRRQPVDNGGAPSAGAGQPARATAPSLAGCSAKPDPPDPDRRIDDFVRLGGRIPRPGQPSTTDPLARWNTSQLGRCAPHRAAGEVARLVPWTHADDHLQREPRARGSARWEAPRAPDRPTPRRDPSFTRGPAAFTWRTRARKWPSPFASRETSNRCGRVRAMAVPLFPRQAVRKRERERSQVGVSAAHAEAQPVHAARNW